MSIHFSQQQWKTIKQTYRKWWAGELDRPIVGYTLDTADPGRPEPELPYMLFTAAYDLAVPAEEIVDRWDYELSKQEFCGEAYPKIWLNYGAGVMAAFLGAQLSYNADGDTVWFHPTREYDITATRFEYDPDNIWLNRAKDIYRAAVARWNGSVQVGMTDLGGALDILSSFFPGEQLLMHLYDYPQHVERLIWDLHELWWKYYDEFNAILQPSNQGYTSWDGIFSETTFYMLQCDFCYMIGPDMFRTFVLPELEASCKRLDHAFYHMDGPGQIAHLDMLLNIEALKGIQWVPGAGNSSQAKDWMNVYGKIIESGKKVQLMAGESIEQLSGYNANGQLLNFNFNENNRHIADAFLGK